LPGKRDLHPYIHPPEKLQPMKIIVSIGLFCLALALNAQPHMQADYTGTTGYLVPRGWTVLTDQGNGVYSWQAQERPDEPGSPGLMVIAMADPGGDLGEMARYLLQQAVTGLQIQDEQRPGAGEVHLRATGTVQGLPARMTAMAMRDQTNFYFATFAAQPQDYEQLGGDQLLYQSLQRPNPFRGSSTTAPASPLSPAAAGTASTGGRLNMQDVTVQQALLQQGNLLSPGQLQGRWVQVMSMMTGDDYQSVTSGEVRMGERGYGHILELQPGGQYRLTYQYNSFSGGCEYQAQVVETGRYRISGHLLSLERGGYQGSFNVCGQRTPQQVQNPPALSFRIGTDASGQHMVLQGKPFEYSISQDTDAYGNPLFQEGFYRE
jgi:hypothetical protein